jgi:DNA-binding beta-propeller fold protein YncE
MSTEPSALRRIDSRTAAPSVFLLLAIGCAVSRPAPDIAYFPAPPAEPHVVHLKSFDRLHDLVAHRPTWAEILRGEPISPHVDTPAGIAFSNGHLYICDSVAGAVQDWDLSTGRAAWIGTGATERLITPVAVAVADSGNVFVADTGRSDVVQFAANGAFLRSMKKPESGTYKPASVAVHGDRLYAADMAAQAVDVYSTADGRHLQTIGGPGSDPGRFAYPSGVTTNSAGALLVSELLGARVQVLSPDGEVTTSFGQPGDRYGEMGRPKHLAVGPDGVIFVADAGFGRLHLFNAQGQLLMLLGDRTGGNEVNGAIPFGVAVAPSLPHAIASWVPDDFRASYFLFVSHSLGPERLSLYAVGGRP